MAICLGLELALYRVVTAQGMFTCVKVYLFRNLFLVESGQNMSV